MSSFSDTETNPIEEYEADKLLNSFLVSIIILPLLAYAFQFVIWRLFNVDVPWYWDCLGGFMFQRYMFHVPFLVWLLSSYGVNVNLVHTVAEKLQ